MKRLNFIKTAAFSLLASAVPVFGKEKKAGLLELGDLARKSKINILWLSDHKINVERFFSELKVSEGNETTNDFDNFQECRTKFSNGSNVTRLSPITQDCFFSSGKIGWDIIVLDGVPSDNLKIPKELFMKIKFLVA